MWGAALATLVSWWRSPENALGSRFDAFDVQGIVPVAYSVFAVALGIGVGSLFRRVLPAIATTLGVFVALRVAVAVYLRPHFLAPLTKTFPLSGPHSTVPAGSWFLSSSIVGPAGRSIGRGFTPDNLPAACRIRHRRRARGASSSAWRPTGSARPSPTSRPVGSGPSRGSRRPSSWCWPRA